MKTVFEGKVNDQVFNNVCDYNNALMEALAGNAEVLASSKTYTVEDKECEPQPSESKPKFRGIVNGTEFYDVESYNKAVMEVLESGQPLNATSETYLKNNVVPAPCCEEDQCCSDQECNEYEPNWFFGMEEDREVYYLDLMKGNSDDESILNEWENGLKNNLEEVVQGMRGFSQQDFNDYCEDLQDVLKQITQDKDNIDTLNVKFNSDILKCQQQEAKLVELIEEYQKQLCKTRNQLQAAAENIQVMDSCKKMNTLMMNHYNYLLNLVNTQLINNEGQTQCCEEDQHIDTNTEEVIPQQEQCINDELKEISELNLHVNNKFRELLKKIFPSLD